MTTEFIFINGKELGELRQVPVKECDWVQVRRALAMLYDVDILQVTIATKKQSADLSTLPKL